MASTPGSGAAEILRSASTGLRNAASEFLSLSSTASSGHFGLGIGGSGHVAAFSRSSTLTCTDVINDEEALRWAAIEKLPTYDRLRKAILVKHVDGGSSLLHEEVDVTKLGLHDRQQLMEKILQVTEKDNERLLLKLRNRIDQVGIDLPKIEVRFEHLTINADVYVGSKALPTLYNFTVNTIRDVLTRLHLVPSNKHNLTILHDVSGLIKPSRMTLLLGPPASGKTTLLLALSGKLDPALRVSGHITYNGHEFSEFVPQRTSAYISQYDVQNGEMTVRETLDFCGRCQGVGTRYDMLMELLRRERAAGIKPDPDIDVFMKATAVEGAKTSLVTDYVLKILGLNICADTLVGNEMRRGISGGQKKRVTTGEMLVGPAKALFMDEISTGLDSSTTYQIVKCLRQSVHVMDGTMLVSLLQPAPETFELFDDIILLSEGHIVYQGPRDSAMDFFGHMGFKCPERKSVADFLQEVTSKKDQQQYWADKNKPYRFIPVTEFATAFKSFHVGQHLMQDLSIPFDKANSHPASLSTQKYGLPERDLLKASFAREWLLMKRNAFVYIFATFQMSIVALITMSVFFRTTLHHRTIQDGNLYLGALFFTLVVTMFNGFSEISLTVFRLPLFFKERDMLLYPAWAFTLPVWALRLPLSFFQTGVWVAITYYTVGFAPEAERFFQQYLVLFLLHQMAIGLFRFIAGLGRTMVIAATFGTLSLVIVFVCGGFVISKGAIPSWWIWGYWISPLMYSQNAISVNEFLAPRWTMPNPDPSIHAETVGKAILKSRGLYAVSDWYWIGIGAMFGFMVLFNVLFTITLAYLNPLGKPQAIITKETLKEKQASNTEEVSVQMQESGSMSQKEGRVSSGGDAQISLSHLSSTAVSDQSDAEFGGKIPVRRGMVLPFQLLSITFSDISYYVDMPAEMKKHGVEEDRLQLLENVNGAFRPGVLTALVGVSGAGKTTLMDVLAGRKTGGYIEGTISISGYPKRQETFTRISGYCEQNDIHSPNVTVYESLVYSAWLRLPNDVKPKMRLTFVEEVMELVELSSLRHALVGLPGVNGLSTEQRKRLTIAVELVANPSIIFMDEPTSGLDARAAAIVMRTVRNTVDTGRTVVCTIHQPSIDIFESFDELLLLKRGGQVIYGGPLGRHSVKLVEYFERIDGVPKIKEGYNPATWMLEVSSQAVETRLGVDFAEIYKNSDLYLQNKERIKELSSPPLNSQDLHFPTKYARSFMIQTLACLWKQHRSYWRNPYYIVVRFFFTIASALFFGSIYWNRGRKTGTAQDLLNIMGGMFAATIFIGVNNSSSVQPVVGVERTVFYREKGAGMYSALPYALAQASIEVPYTVVQSLLYASMVYSMCQFEWAADKFLWFVFFMFFSFLTFTYYGMMCVAVTPSHHISAIISSAFYGIWNLFSGFIVPRTAIPIWWRWYYWATPVAWTLYGLIASQFGDKDDTHVNVPGQGSRIISEYIKSYFGFKHSFLGIVSVMEVVFAALFVGIFAFSIKYLNFQRR